MKKFAIFALTLASINAMAWEVNVKTGYEPIRGQISISNPLQLSQIKDLNQIPNKPISQGFVVGAEFIPFNKGTLELGLGAEFKFNTIQPDKKLEESFVLPTLENSVSTQTKLMLPVYQLVKYDFFRSEDNGSSVYLLGRLGYAFSTEKETSQLAGNNRNVVGQDAQPDAKSDFNNKGGLYAGLGLGADFGPYMVEGVVDGIFRTPYIGSSDSAHTLTYSVGIRFGARFGDYMVAKKVEVEPVMVEEPVMAPVVEEPVMAPIVVEEPVVLPTPTPKPKKQLIHASRAFEGEVPKCIIHGFKIEGKVPSKEEQQNIREIVQQVNDFAISGVVSVVGHTDATGTEKYNQTLSEKRAASVVKLLNEFGLKPEIKIENVSGKGELEPMATNKNREGRTLNRRVEIIFNEIDQ